VQIAGLGPFRLKEYVAGQRIVLERNPHYWKVDRQKRRLPYLDELVFLVAPSEDAQVIRFQAGETDVLSRVNAKNYSVLARDPRASGYRLLDLGPGLEYNFLFFNLNDLSGKTLPDVARKQAWFRDVRFRQAVSAAIDREGIVRLVYEGRATPLWAHVTPGNKLWVNGAVPRAPQSLDRAKKLLQEAGFAWRSDGALVDAQGQAVEFSIVTSASNAARVQMATIIQDDLKKLGMTVQVVPIEFRSLLDRVFNTHTYEASLSGLVSGDADPTAEMNVWTTGGATHLWNLTGAASAAPWEAEIDRLMQQQLVTLKYEKRKQHYDRVQQLVAENLPLICLVSPNVLVGAKTTVGNFKPAILEPATLWNADELFLVAQGGNWP
jgi:peptide/nickel transport system substrate-binding protein